jgi:hypothetical protein
MNGTFRGKAKSWALAKASTGTPQVAVEFEVFIEGGSTRRTWYGFLTDKTLENTVESLRAMGWQGEDLSQLEGLDANEVDLVIQEEADEQGNARDRIRWVNKIGGGLAVKSVMSEGEAKALGAELMGRIKALGSIGGQRKASANAKPPQRSDADSALEKGMDIPF